MEPNVSLAATSQIVCLALCRLLPLPVAAASSAASARAQPPESPWQLPSRLVDLRTTAPRQVRVCHGQFTSHLPLVTRGRAGSKQTERVSGRPGVGARAGLRTTARLGIRLAWQSICARA
jgi:hypothetical protein